MRHPERSAAGAKSRDLSHYDSGEDPSASPAFPWLSPGFGAASVGMTVIFVFSFYLQDDKTSFSEEDSPMAPPEFLIHYLPILMFLVIAGGMSCVMIGASLLFGPHKPDPEKLSAYECGFEAFGDARSKFDVRFYLVTLLFIIFDLEIAFLFPWAISLGKIGMFGFWSMMVFLGVLTVGFIYEWKKGALDWE